MRALRRRWRSPAFEVFLWSRASIWVGAVFALLSFTASPARPRQQAHDLGFGLDVWARWDSDWYLRIARSGYEHGARTAFFPLYPMAVRVVGHLFGGHDVVAGVVISLAACLASFVLLASLAGRLLDEAGARRTLTLLAVYPMSLFLQAVYAESLYLVLALACFVLAERRRFLGAAGAAGLAMLTRSAGVALLPALAVFAWRSEQRARAFCSLLAAPLIFCLWPLLLWHSVGDPFAFLRSQREWGRHLSAAGPFGGLWDGLRAAVRGARYVVHAHLPVPPHPGAPQTSPLQVAVQNIGAFVFALVLLGLAVVAWRRLGLAYGLFAVVSLGIALAVPTSGRPLLSLPRFGLAIFPIFIALASITASPRRYAAAVAVSALFCGIAVAQWAHYEWVA
jgi:hypothetical protein